MKLRTLALVGAAAWLYSNGPRDPREWPAYLGEQFAVLKDQVGEAVTAGREASARRQEELDREVRLAMGQEP